MKSISPKSLLAAAAVLTMFLVQSCHEPPASSGDIPYDEDKARSNVIPIKAARAYTAHFRAVRDTFDKEVPDFESKLRLYNAEMFNRDAIALLLNQKDSTGKEAAGIRIYNGLNAKGQQIFVLVPVDANGNDIVNQLIINQKGPNAQQFRSGGDSGQTVENGQRCPEICDDGNSGLNGPELP